MQVLIFKKRADAMDGFGQKLEDHILKTESVTLNDQSNLKELWASWCQNWEVSPVPLECAWAVACPGKSG